MLVPSAIFLQNWESQGTHFEKPQEFVTYCN